MDQAEIPSLLSRLGSDEDATRKMAVFKLQSSINDPAFADVFISSGGLAILHRLIMSTSANTLAYSLQSLSRLLEVDMGWEIFEQAGAGELVERVVELIVTHPLVNILRGAMSILVGIVSHSQSPHGAAPRSPGAFGFRALRPAIAVYPQFFEMVVTQLNSADHALCANALMLLNALMRDAISTDGEGKSSGTGEDWPKFIKRLQDLGVIKAAYLLMQGSALQDLAHPLLDFQALTKVLLRKWKEVQIDLERPEHRRALKGLHLASAPEKRDDAHDPPTESEDRSGKKGSKKHNPEKWRRLGFETESPAHEFEYTGFLGMMDLTDFVRRQEDLFQKTILEQSAQPFYQRCPIARASLAVTTILYEHFEVDASDVEDAKNYLDLDGSKNYDRIFRPLLLQWSKLHVATVHAFFRLWKDTSAEQEDFDKVAELVRILVEQVIGQATRTKDIREVEEELASFECARLREMQMEILDLTFEEDWGQHLVQVREELRREALQFVKEQRIRCLLEGAWFPRSSPKGGLENGYHGDAVSRTEATAIRYVKLSHNRRYLHYGDFDPKPPVEPKLEQLHDKIDLGTVSSVVSNVSANNHASSPHDDGASSMTSTSTLKMTIAPSALTNGSSQAAARSKKTDALHNRSHPNKPSLNTTTTSPTTSPSTTTKITINTNQSPTPLDIHLHSKSHSRATTTTAERPLLTLLPATPSLASEWLDGLLMLLHQAPITAETHKLVALVAEYGLKIRLLNVRLDGPPPVLGEGGDEVGDEDGVGGGGGGNGIGIGVVPSREGLDEDYWFEV